MINNNNINNNYYYYQNYYYQNYPRTVIVRNSNNKYLNKTRNNIRENIEKNSNDKNVNKNQIKHTNSYRFMPYNLINKKNSNFNPYNTYVSNFNYNLFKSIPNNIKNINNDGNANKNYQNYPRTVIVRNSNNKYLNKTRNNIRENIEKNSNDKNVNINQTKIANSYRFMPYNPIINKTNLNLNTYMSNFNYDIFKNINNKPYEFINKKKLNSRSKSFIMKKTDDKSMEKIMKNIQENNTLNLLKPKKEKPLNNNDRYILRELKRDLSEEHERAIKKLTGEGLIDPEKTDKTKFESMKNRFYYDCLKTTPDYVKPLKEYAHQILNKFAEIANNIIDQKKGENIVEKYKDFDENISLLEKECNILYAIAYFNSEEHSAFDREDTEILFKNIMTIFDSEFSNYNVDYSRYGLAELTKKLKYMDTLIHKSMSNTQRNIFEELEDNSCLNISEKDHEFFYNALKTAYIYCVYSQDCEKCIEELDKYFGRRSGYDENKEKLKELFEKEMERRKNHYYAKKFHIEQEREHRILEIIFLYLLTAIFDEKFEKELLSNNNEDSVLEVFLNEFNNDERLDRHENLIDICYKDMFTVFISNYSPYEYYIVGEILKNIANNNIDINLNFGIERFKNLKIDY